MAIDIKSMDVSSRDFLSIYSDLKSAIPNLSQDWNTNDENDPGMVLVKLMSMRGDMLSYNLDRAVLEIYPDSVSQRKNASQIFNLIGYKMHWYQSATCIATVSNIGDTIAYIPTLTTFITSDGSISYTYLGNQFSLSSSASKEVELIQGIPKYPNLLGSEIIPANPNDPWYSVYDYNIVKSDIRNNKIFFSEKAVDETSIILIDGAGEQWKQVERLDAQITSGKFFELKTDANDNPYIELVPYWQNMDGIAKFRLFYIQSAGADGQITANSLSYVNSRIVTSGNVNLPSNVISISNNASTIGYNYETPQEARDNSANYVNTFNTLITLNDFEKATKRVPGVANCMATDKTNDPDPSSMNATDVNIYITRKDPNGMDPTAFKDLVSSYLNSKKHINLNLNLLVDEEGGLGTTYYSWKFKGLIHLKEKVSRSVAQNLLIQIRQKLYEEYSTSNVPYNSIIGYLGVIETIKSVSNLIYDIDVDGIEYWTRPLETVPPTPSVQVDKETITGKYFINTVEDVGGTIVNDVIYKSVNLDGTIQYDVQISNTPIKPGSVNFVINNGRIVIADDKIGDLVCDDAQFIAGTVDYTTGVISFTLSSMDTTNVVLNYSKNVIGMVKYEFDIADLSIAEESIEL